jgi:iron-sulfur cluster assembly protein
VFDLGFDNEGDADKVVDVGGINLIVDNRSILYLAGSAIDFEGGLNGTGFKIVNPNANRTCGCGESFTV